MLVLCRPSLVYKGRGYSIFRAELPIGIVGVYGIGNHAFYSHLHKLLLHTDTVLQAYSLIGCLERDRLNEQYAVYLFAVDLRTELNGLCSLTSHDKTDIDNTITYLPVLK